MNDKKIEFYLKEISLRREVLTNKQQIQAAENTKERQTLDLWEKSIIDIQNNGNIIKEV